MGQGSGKHKANYSTRGARVTCASQTGGVCLWMMKYSQEGLEALRTHTEEDQPGLRAETYTVLVGH